MAKPASRGTLSGDIRHTFIIRHGSPVASVNTSSDDQLFRLRYLNALDAGSWWTTSVVTKNDRHRDLLCSAGGTTGDFAPLRRSSYTRQNRSLPLLIWAQAVARCLADAAISGLWRHTRTATMLKSTMLWCER